MRTFLCMTAFALAACAAFGQTAGDLPHFEVADIEGAIAELQSRGITFDEYETPKTVNFVAQLGPARGAWFRDPDGNVLGLREGPLPGVAESV